MSTINLRIKELGFPWEAQDPFLFCAYHRDEYPKGDEKMRPAVSLAGRTIGNDFIVKDGWRMYHGQTYPGFPYHPHRGFETITICKEGVVDHSDSLGASGRFGTGDVQWMTAGKGILHSEMFPLIKQDDENPLEIFQLWLNLPQKDKFVAPHFKMLWAATVPEINYADVNGNTTKINLIAGRLLNKNAAAPTPNSWAANPTNNVSILTVKMQPNAQWELPVLPEDINRSIYFYKGSSIVLNETRVDYHAMIEAPPKTKIQLKSGNNDCYLLILEGKPINEPVVKYGPFVMNTEEEIQQAFAEYRETQFGGWPWPAQEQVHARDRGRFAHHANGVKEKP